MRDLLPEEARSRRLLARKALDCFALHGYVLVTPPVFEFADVLERGLGTLDPAEVLRFVEPESGEVAALRPDMTPQIARIIATRLHDRPPPHRLAYEGSVLRRRMGRARKHRQIPQVGVELAGVPAPEGDVEILELASAALRAAGLESHTLDVADAGVVRSLLEGAAPEALPSLARALSAKDEGAVLELGAGLPHVARLAALTRIHGGAEAMREGLRALAGTPSADAAERLRALYEAAVARGLPVTVDFGEVRGFAYYTGMMFHAYAPGPGEAIGGGGRYDELFARFGRSLPAVGMGLDLDNLAWSLRASGAVASSETRVLVARERAAAEPLLNDLRGAGFACALHAGGADAIAYAKAWGFSFVVSERITDVRSSKTYDIGPSVSATIAAIGRGG
jgi:ATP phosphoribosyltransferase regulatory subunit